MTPMKPFRSRARHAGAQADRVRLGLCLVCVVLSLAGCGRKSEAEWLASAQGLLAKPDEAAAFIELKTALDENPESASLRALLGVTLLRAGNPAGAAIELNKALERGASADQVIPELARAMLAKGEAQKLIGQFGATSLQSDDAALDLKLSLAGAHASLGEVDQARDLASAVLKMRPGQAAASVIMARIQASAGNTAAALQHLDAVLARDEGNEQAGLLKGEILLRVRKEPDAALAALQSVVKAHPGSTLARATAAAVLLQLGKGVEARAELKQLQKSAPRHVETLFLQAQVAFDDKDFKASREMAEQLLNQQPNSLRLLMLAGASEYQMQHYSQADGLLSRALKLAPNLLAARHLLAQSQLRAGQPDKAVEALLPVMKSPKPDAASLALLGEAYLDLGDSKQSEAAFQQALKADASGPGTGLLTSMAEAQFARGDTGAAVAQLESLSKADKGIQADLALVSARLQLKDTAGALRAVDGLAKKQPNRAQAPLLRARILQQQGDLAGSAASFEEALAKEPGHFGAISGLAELDFKAGKHAQARKRFEDLVKAAPRNQAAKLALAQIDARLGVPPATVAAGYREAIRVDPLQPGPHLTLISHLRAHGDVQGSLAAAQEATAALPNDLAIMDALGLAQLGAGEGQRAVSTFKKLTGLQPSKASHFVRLADAHLLGKDRDAAMAALRQAQAIDPGNLLAQRALALLALRDNRPQDALAIARSVQKQLPKEAAGFALEGEIQAGQKNWAAAASAYSAALQRGSNTELAMRLHHSLTSAGKASEAARLVADWRKSNPADAGFSFYLGERATLAQDWSASEAHFRDVLTLQPRNAAAMNNLAWLMVRSRQPGAVAMAQQAEALMPNRAPFLDTLAAALESENQLDKAIETQKRAVQLDAKNPYLRLHLAQLLSKNGDKAGAREQLNGLSALGANFPGQAEAAALLKSL
jgi:putative PEP-CTERM system TPR-repeat lipoprotein